MHFFPIICSKKFLVNFKIKAKLKAKVKVKVKFKVKVKVKLYLKVKFTVESLNYAGYFVLRVFVHQEILVCSIL